MSHGLDGLEGEGGDEEDEANSGLSLSMGAESHSTTSRIFSSSLTNPSSEIPSSVNALDKVHRRASFFLLVLAKPAVGVEVSPT